LTLRFVLPGLRDRNDNLRGRARCRKGMRAPIDRRRRRKARLNDDDRQRDAGETLDCRSTHDPLRLRAHYATRRARTRCISPDKSDYS
jgi:hypothetical protein